MQKTVSPNSDQTSADLSLIPRPVEVIRGKENFELTADTVLFYEGAAAASVATLFAEQLRAATGFALPVRQQETEATKAIVFKLSEEGAFAREEYSLNVSGSGAVIIAGDVAGLFYGGQTLRQLLPPEIFGSAEVARVWVIPGVTIRDFPRFGWRGMLLDVSRHFMGKDEVLRFIDTLAALKFNCFHWHLTDDQGWRIEIKKYPRLTEIGAWRKETQIVNWRFSPFDPVQEWPDVSTYIYDGIPHGGFYTQDDIREVVHYAKERCITVIPEIDMPGHMQAAIAAYPELGSTQEPVEVGQAWGVGSAVLNPEESTLQFCRDVLSEVFELFPSEYIHIGGDEVNKTQWENNPRVHELCAERGLKDMFEMQSWFIRKIGEFLSENGRRLIGWDEILEGGLTGDVTVMAWRSEEKGAEALKAGFPVVVASQKFYFDYYQAAPIENEPLAIPGFAPMEKVYSYNPVPPGLTPEEEGRVLGAQGQLWTEYIPTMKQVEYMAFPRSCALAEVVWSPDEGKDYECYLRRLPTELKRLEYAGIHYRSLDHGATLEKGV